MEGLGSVQHKVSCIFETTVLNEQSSKRENQSYKVVASERIKQRAIDNDVHTALVTEKFDGTCVYIARFEGKPWLWARYDRKPTKGAERRFKKFQQQKQREKGSDEGSDKNSPFKWDMAKDFKETPEFWIPASGVQIIDGSPIPDDIGHTPGWVPVSPSSRQQCWHLSAVNLNIGLALVLREKDDGEELFIDCIPMSELEGHTAELIGTNINGNAYAFKVITAYECLKQACAECQLRTPEWITGTVIRKHVATLAQTPDLNPQQFDWMCKHIGNTKRIGCKQIPVHVLVIHGSFRIRNPPEIQMETIKEWFQKEGQVEGIVWHCANGTLFKLHRNHVALPWPVQAPTLILRPVTITVDTTKYELDNDDSLIAQFGKLRGHQCESMKDLKNLFMLEKCVETRPKQINSTPFNSDPVMES